MLKEIWKDINGYEGLYQVSNLGRVKSLPNGRHKEAIILKQAICSGYYCVRLFKNGQGKSYRVNRLVALAFIPNPNNLPQVGHKDENNFRTGDGCNNCVENLEWVTAKENSNTVKRKQRLSEANKGKNNPSYGKHHTKEWKENMSEKNKGENNPNYGNHKLKGHTLNAKRVECEGMIFPSLLDMAEYYHMSVGNFSSFLNGKKKMPQKWKERGLKWVEE